MSELNECALVEFPEEVTSGREREGGRERRRESKQESEIRERGRGGEREKE